MRYIEENMDNTLNSYLEFSPIVFFKWDATENWPVIYVSNNVQTILGYSTNDFLKGRIEYISIIDKADILRVTQEMTYAISQHISNFTHQPYRLLKADGNTIWVEDKTKIIYNEFGEIEYFFGYISDITPLKILEEERHRYLISLEHSNKELLKAINSLNEYKHVLDESNIISMSDTQGNITYVNDAFISISGYSKNELIGKPHSIVRHPDTPKVIFEAMWNAIQNKEVWKGIFKNRKKDGSAYFVDMTVAPFLDANGNIEKYIGIRHDITELVQKSEAIREQAITDSLTGHGNRTKLLLDIHNANNPYLALFDIASFNEINDFYGYGLGDKLIEKLGEVFSELSNNIYRIYRPYADQFIILCDSENNDIFENQMREWQIRLNQSPIMIENKEIHVRMICVLSYEAKEDILTTIDIAQNYAKREGLDCVVFHPQIELAKEYELNIYWQQKLSFALKNGGIIPYFQPILDNHTGKIEKYEALVRLVNNEEVFSPAHFLAIAKKTKQYTEITKQMIQKSFEFFANNNFICSVNLTLEDIKNSSVLEALGHFIESYQMQKRIIFELVESEGIQDFKEVNLFLKDVKEYGCALAIDDFGTGYSNFNYLIKLDANYIKLDGSIIQSIHNQKSGALEIVQAIVLFAKSRGIKTVAEFVSSKEIFDTVCSLGIDYSQGYYIGEPKPNLL